MFGNHLQLNDSGHFVETQGHFMVRRKPMDYLLIWVLAGRGFSETEGRRLPAGPGHLLCLLPGKPHTYGSDRRQPWDILWVHFEGSLAREFVASIRRFGGARVDLDLHPELRDRWIELVVAHAVAGPGSKVRCDTALCGLLGLIVSRLEANAHPSAVKAPLDVHRLQTYIHHHLRESLTLAALARQANLSPTHFVRVFKKQFAVSPMHFVTQKRIALACSLLRETTMPLKEISPAVGYADPYYGSRVFKKVMGVSPMHYRARVK